MTRCPQALRRAPLVVVALALPVAALATPDSSSAKGPRIHARHASRRPGHTSRVPMFIGTTSQLPGRYGVQSLPDNRVTFQRSKTGVDGFTIPWLADCTDTYHRNQDDPLIDVAAIDSLPLAQGRFSAEGVTYTISPGPGQVAYVRLDLQGIVQGRKASGTLSVSARIVVDGEHISDFCKTTSNVYWQATLRKSP